ncbi:MAG: sulfatase family protein [Planctomycetota bacterium]
MAGLSYAAPRGFSQIEKGLKQVGNRPNVLILIFDAWSAVNCSLYGYPRDTTPNLNRLAEKVTVYHNHYSAGTWTIPGTSSLLTGTLPWGHRAFGMHGMAKGEVSISNDFVNKSIFHVFSDYHRVAYSHNLLAEEILNVFFDDIDDLIPRHEWYLKKERLLDIFNNDVDAAMVAFNRGLKHSDGYGYSLFLEFLFDLLDRDIKREGLNEKFPLGIPGQVIDNEQYLLEDGVDNLLQTILSALNPYIAYCHFMPPHDPYNTRVEFYKRFHNDGYAPLRKPFHLLRKDNVPQISSVNEYTYAQMEDMRTEYDEYILYVDAEFARLHDMLERKKILENTILVLTTDHGEMFERGVVKHATKLMHQPIVRVPLVIFEPGQTTRRDVYEKTSAIDILPTLSHLTGHDIPQWSEGHILPPYSDKTSGRDIFIIDSRANEENAPIEKASIALIRAPYKMMYYVGYRELDGGDYVELYDIDADPEEMDELSLRKPTLAKEMLQSIKAKLAKVNEPYLD